MKILKIIIAVFLFCSCSSTYMINHISSDENIKILNSLSGKYNSKIVLKDSTQISSESLFVANDSLYFPNSEKNPIAINKVRSIVLKDKWDGFADGLLFGLAAATTTVIISMELSDNTLSVVEATLVAFVGTFAVFFSQGHEKTFVFE